MIIIQVTLFYYVSITLVEVGSFISFGFVGLYLLSFQDKIGYINKKNLIRPK